MKLCNDLLLTAQWMDWYDSLTTENCLHCGEIKNRDHVITCSFKPCQIWWNSLLTKLRNGHDSNSSDHYLLDILTNGLTKLRNGHDSNSSDHYLLDILTNGLDCWYNGTTLSPNRYHQCYHSLIMQNNQPSGGSICLTDTSRFNGDSNRIITMSESTKSTPLHILALAGPPVL
jgi:hypothetical protein